MEKMLLTEYLGNFCGALMLHRFCLIVSTVVMSQFVALFQV